MKLQLVYAASSRYPNSSDLSGWSPPLGVLTVATELKERSGKDLDIEVFDSQIQDREWIAKRLDGDVVGISCGILSYEDALYFANETSGKVVMGGPYVSSIPHLVATNQRGVIDNVVVGHGTPTLEKIIQGKDVGRIETNPMNFESFPIVDRSFLPKEDYIEKYREKFPDSTYLSPTGIVPQMGCEYKSRGKGCVFCSGPGLSTSRTPEQFWEEIRSLSEKGYDYISIQGEEFLGDLNWFNAIYESRPESNVPLDITTRASRINEENLRKLKNLNVQQIFIGVESGSQELLNSSLKGMRKEQIEKAVKLMKEYEIKTKTTYVLGLPGETQETLDETRHFANHLCEIGNIGTIGVSILTPTPGSPAYEIFCKKFPKYRDYDIFPIEESRKLWIQEFCDIDYNHLVNATYEISSMAKTNFGFAR